jgi:hypothetical protein
MIYNMAELNQFQRSKDRLNEILCYLMNKKVVDEQTDLYMKTIQTSIKTLEQRIEDYKRERPAVGN